MIKLLTALIFALACTTASRASVLYSDITISGNTGIGLPVGTCCEAYVDAWYGVLFTPTIDGTAAQMDVWVGQDGDNEITAGIFTDDGGVQGTELAEGTADITIPVGEQEVDFTSPVDLSSSQSYYAVFTAPVLTDSDYTLIVTAADEGNEYVGQSDSIEDFYLPQFDVETSSATPEPATFMLCALGFFVLILWRTRARLLKTVSRPVR